MIVSNFLRASLRTMTWDIKITSSFYVKYLDGKRADDLLDGNGHRRLKDISSTWWCGQCVAVLEKLDLKSRVSVITLALLIFCLILWIFGGLSTDRNSITSKNIIV